MRTYRRGWAGEETAPAAPPGGTCPAPARSRSARLCFAPPLTLKYSGEGGERGIRPPSKQVEDLQRLASRRRCVSTRVMVDRKAALFCMKKSCQVSTNFCHGEGNVRRKLSGSFSRHKIPTLPHKDSGLSNKFPKVVPATQRTQLTKTKPNQSSRPGDRREPTLRSSGPWTTAPAAGTARKPVPPASQWEYATVGFLFG